ncbi:MAG: phosphopantetheine-binding protein [Lautropia sp.]|nr:phosphopantetheine-binding protein [Lautropia sp.]
MSTLTLEQMREDLARTLLEDPANIHDDDNLLDLGLDSMRAMTLASRWQTAGARLDFSEMALEPTLAHWWKLIQEGSKKG